MEHIIILYDFDSDRASLSGGEWSPDLPASNMQNDRLYKVARTSNVTLAATQFSVEFSSAVSPLAFAMLRTNISGAGSWRLRGFTDAGHTIAAYDSGWTPATPRVPFGTIMYGMPWLYDGIIPSGHDEARGRMIFRLMPDDVSAQYWLVEIDDVNNPYGYIDIGRLVFSTGFQPSVNDAFGATLTFIDNSVSASTLSGGEIRWHRLAPRSMRFSLEYLPDEELFGATYNLMRRAGYDNQVFVIPDPADSGEATYRRSFLGTLKSMDGLSQAIIKHGNTGFEIKEVIL